jgi:hypothetical protein
MTAREEERETFSAGSGASGYQNFILERRVERVPVLSGRSSRHGDQGLRLHMGMRQAVTAREEDSNFQQTLGRERIPKD